MSLLSRIPALFRELTILNIICAGSAAGLTVLLMNMGLHLVQPEGLFEGITVFRPVDDQRMVFVMFGFPFAIGLGSACLQVLLSPALAQTADGKRFLLSDSIVLSLLTYATGAFVGIFIDYCVFQVPEAYLYWVWATSFVGALINGVVMSWLLRPLPADDDSKRD